MALNPIIFPFGFRLARYNCLLPGGPENDFSKPVGSDKIMRLLGTCWWTFWWIWDGEDPVFVHNVRGMTTWGVQLQSSILKRRSWSARNEAHCYSQTKIKTKNRKTKKKENKPKLNTKFFLYMDSLNGKAISLHPCNACALKATQTHLAAGLGSYLGSDLSDSPSTVYKTWMLQSKLAGNS